jgi:hypothetical protein
LPWVILVSNLVKFEKRFSSETRRHNDLLLCKNNSMGNQISLYVLIKYCKSFLLLQVGFKDYVDTFLGCLVDGDILLRLTEDELQNSIGMTCKIARKRFVNHGNHVFVQSDEIRKSYRGPSIDVPCKMLLYLAKRFQRRRFLENGPPETRIAYAGHIC